MFEVLPVMKLSIAMTRCPSASRRSVRCDPRKPAPPVTTEMGWEGERVNMRADYLPAGRDDRNEERRVFKAFPCEDAVPGWRGIPVLRESVAGILPTSPPDAACRIRP